MSVIVKLLSKFDDSGIKKAKSSFGGLKTALGAVGIGFGLKQITDGLLDAAKAASADQKSMQLLNNQLKKNAGATTAQIKQNDKFIDSLSNQVGIVDDELRPAMGQLVRVTGDTRKSQQLLKLALDASATTGKPLATVTAALSKAFVGNKTSLVRLFPALKESKNLFADLEKTVGGAAIQQADPFAKFNVAMDNLKEKLGAVILPYLVDFIDTMMKPGGAIDQVSKFLDDVSNPKTEAGKMFLQVKDAVAQTIDAVKVFFGYFGDGDAMKGFANVASSLVRMLPALLALKGILMLASAGKSIANLAKAIGLMTGANAIPGGGGGVPSVVGGGKPTGGFGAKLGFLKFLPMVGVGADFGAIQTKQEQMQTPEGRKIWEDIYRQARNKQKESSQSITNNVTIQVQNADPKATVDSLSKYLKQNGFLTLGQALRKG